MTFVKNYHWVSIYSLETGGLGRIREDRAYMRRQTLTNFLIEPLYKRACLQYECTFVFMGTRPDRYLQI